MVQILYLAQLLPQGVVVVDQEMALKEQAGLVVLVVLVAVMMQHKQAGLEILHQHPLLKDLMEEIMLELV